MNELQISIYTCEDGQNAEGFTVVGTIFSPVHGALVPDNAFVTGATPIEVHDKLRAANVSADVIFVCDEPRKGRLRYLALLPKSRDMRFVGNDRAAVSDQIDRWYEASRARMEARFSDKAGKAPSGHREPVQAASKGKPGPTPQDAVEALKRGLYKSQAEIGAAIGLAQPQVSALLIKAQKDDLITKDEIAHFYAIAKGRAA